MKRSVRLLTAAVAAIALLSPPAAVAADDDFRLVYFPHNDVASAFGNDWGDSRSGGRGHRGTDILATKHSEVVAVADGFVVATNESPRSGFYVRIAHHDGWESWYLHLNNDTPGTDDGAGGAETAFAPDLEVGMFVSAGTVIGYVGDSGNAEGASSHTHFELHDGSRAVNPYPYLADAHSCWLRVMELANDVR